MPKLEVNWTREGADGAKRQVFAHRIGDRWAFFSRAARFDDWKEMPSPPLEDWLELLDGVRRRVGRRLARPEDEKHLVGRIRALFPDADLG